MNGIKETLYKRILEKKIRINQQPPPHPDLQTQINTQTIIEYTHSSNAIEGNTLTLGETAKAINGETINGKTIQEYFEAHNHPAAIQYIKTHATQNKPITTETIKETHRLLMNQLMHEPGAYRTGAAKIQGAHFMPPKSTEIPQKITELLTWLHTNPYEYPPIEQAARFMHRLLVIHPFQDGNGRTTRLLMNHILIQNNYPVLTNISHRNRKQYLNALREADQQNYEPLITHVAICVEEALTKHLIATNELETLTLREAAKQSPYTQDYLGLRARNGSLGAYKQGRNWRITREDLNHYIKQNQ